MADKNISELTAVTQVYPEDLFVLEHSGSAKKLTGQTLENWLLSFAHGHGGIQSISKTSSTGTDPVVDTYTITLSDETMATFTVTNGLKGDTGDASYVHIKYSSVQPSAQSPSIGDIPNAWMGIRVDTSSTASTLWSDYSWYQIKGETGADSEVTDQTVTYQAGTNEEIPSGIWTSTIPEVPAGGVLWTKTELVFNNDTANPTVFYTYSRQGRDDTGVLGGSDPLPDADEASPGTSLYGSREDHVHPIDYQAITVVSSSSSGSSTAAITYNSSAVSTLNRAYARRIGKLMVLSFVITLSGATTGNTVFFTINPNIAPSEQVDFIVLHNASGSTTFDSAAGQLNQTITVNKPFTGGLLRGEVVWTID